MGSSPTHHLHIFGDESSHDGQSQFLVYGTISCPRERLPRIQAELEAAACGKRAELKWSAPHHRERLPGFVDAIFRCRDKYDLRFRCIVVNKHHEDHSRFKDDNAVPGLEKYIFLHLLTYARRWRGGQAQFHALLDCRSGRQLGEAQKRALNGRDAMESGRGYPIFANVIDVDSKSSRLIQAADVLSGAVAWVMNKRYEDPNASQEKRDLVKHIAARARIGVMGLAAKAGLKRKDFMIFAYPTIPPQEEKGFAIWHLDLKFEKRVEVEAISRAQLLSFDHSTTLDDLSDLGYRIDVECPTCNITKRDVLSNNRSLGQLGIRRRFKCGICQRIGFIRLRRKSMKEYKESER